MLKRECSDIGMKKNIEDLYRVEERQGGSSYRH
jgi:hypothetical protein